MQLEAGAVKRLDHVDVDGARDEIAAVVERALCLYEDLAEGACE